MAIILLNALLAAENMDALFPLHAREELRFTPRRDPPTGRPLPPEAFGLPAGEWHPIQRLELSKHHTAYALSDRNGTTWLVTVENETRKISNRRQVARIERLAGAYEKTTSSRLVPVKSGWDLTVTVFLHDFELDDSASGSRNITGAETTVWRWRDGKWHPAAR